MIDKSDILTDNFGRRHTYLRISLTERCNLRCLYCMPKEGVELTPKKYLMQSNEIIYLAKLFVKYGVNKIRLTGGEPLIRKDFPEIVRKLSQLPVDLSITTNAVIINKHLELLQECNIKTLNVSLDTLQEKRFKTITFRNNFKHVIQNIQELLKQGFNIKINVVLMKGVNDDEIIDFINFTKNRNIAFRFIEFMPFVGNKWKRDKIVSYESILNVVKNYFGEEKLIFLVNKTHDTSRNFKIKDFQGSFGIISTVTNPFCDQCNRIRLTADGKIKNCLFSSKEKDLLTALREGNPIEPIISRAILSKKLVRSGMTTSEDFENTEKHNENRSMITIGG
ncbi:MAG TPA: GTP 3',8-cyclase MoaA [Cytophagales bacterium]|nr:GTP 3',8-cyclase MoaA [Cytophagales bacterium]